MFKHWRSDVEAVLTRDPAARTALEVILCYPSFRAVRRHRRAHWLWTHNMKLLARIVSQRTRRITPARRSARDCSSTTEWGWSSAKPPRSATT